jgi:hypothetical protein
MKKVIVVLVVLSFGINGCAYLGNKGTGALSGAAVGGTAGALISDKDPLLGALIGGTVGALTGLAIGHVADKMVKNAKKTAEDYQYKSDQGTMVQIENVKIVPGLVRPGQQAKLIIDYAVLEGNPAEDIAVTEKRVIKTGNTALKEIGPTPKTRKSGTYSTEQEVVFPSSLSAGFYRLTGEVAANGKMSTKDVAFEVLEPLKVQDGAGGSALHGMRGFAN